MVHKLKVTIGGKAPRYRVNRACWTKLLNNFQVIFHNTQVWLYKVTNSYSIKGQIWRVDSVLELQETTEQIGGED